MGMYVDNLSKRFEHTKIREGFCLICGVYGSLTFDHVPPKGSITITKVEQKHISEELGIPSAKVKGISSNNGSKFRTICSKCNNEILGANDDETSKVCRDMKLKIFDYLKSGLFRYPVIRVEVNARKYIRSMIGHILSATTVEECKRKPDSSEYFQPLKDFVLGNDYSIKETHDIYYWFYPHDKHVSAKSVVFHNDGHNAHLSILSFFPISFMVTKKNEGTYPSHARQLTLDDEYLIFDLSQDGFLYSEFPFHGFLMGQQMLALRESQAIVSYAIKK